MLYLRHKIIEVTMIISVPKEIKSNENRVALTPAGTLEMVKRGHKVYIETNAGKDSGFEDTEYIDEAAFRIQHIELKEKMDSFDTEFRKTKHDFFELIEKVM